MRARGIIGLRVLLLKEGATVSWLFVILTAWGVPAVVIVLLRETAFEYLTSSVERRFQMQLEGLISDFRHGEERLKSDLRAKEQQINTLVGATMAMRSSKQAVLDGRRLQAVEALMAAKAKLDRGKSAVTTMGTFNYPLVCKRVVTDEKLRQFFQMLSQTGGHEAVSNESRHIDIERPFLAPSVWANFVAYRSIILLAMARMRLLANGMDQEGLLDEGSVISILKAAFPGAVDFSPSGQYKLLEPLEQKLFDAIEDMLEGKEANANTIKQAKLIIRLTTMAEELRSQAHLRVEVKGAGDRVKEESAAPKIVS
jgi:hypothetical protein